MENEARLLPVDIEAELKKSFISYAMTVIINRALPDVRDGLKPVHRRILYAMHELGMTSDKPYKKSARIVGEVLGKYHPHGDSAVYDAMVRLAQDFSTRYPLVEGQGNFGSVDGDGAAAMRYTEARMSRLTMEMVADIDKETVSFYPNFDETLMQPSVLPSRFPNLLVNGSGGIAVGMATNIPPHNLREVIDGVLCMLDNEDCTLADLMEHIKGPDFPTGGVIMGVNGIKEAYATGRGRIITRAKSDTEQINANRSRIVVTEIPYQVNKARLIEKIAELVHTKVLDGVSDLRDESDRKGMRIVIELKKDVNPQIVLNTLYKHTQMQETFGVIMLALVDGEPKVLSLKQMLHYYILHQKDVIRRRSRYELDRAQARAHILEGLFIALDHIDEIIHIIRSSRTTQDAKSTLMERFALSDRQAQAILDMRLARLTGLERERLEEEYGQLRKTIEYLNRVLQEDELVKDIIRKEITVIRDKYADERRTEITALQNEINYEDLIQEENMVVTLTHFGYIKRLSPDTYRTQRRGGRGVSGMTTREEDFVENIFITSTHAFLLFFTNKGRVFGLRCYEIPEGGRTARGTAIVNLLQLGPEEKVRTVIPVKEEENAYLLMQTAQGLIKKTALHEYRNLRSTGLIAIGMRETDELIQVRLCKDEDEIMVATRSGQTIRFAGSDVRPMGRSAQGVRSIDVGEDDAVVALDIVNPECMVLSLSENGYGKRSDLKEYRLQSRAGKGMRAMNLSEKTGPMVTQLLVRESDDLMLITDDGTVIRLPVADISIFGRGAQGVRLMRVEENCRVVAATCVPKEEDEPAQEDKMQEFPQAEENKDSALLTELLRRAQEQEMQEKEEETEEDEEGEDQE